MRALNPRLQDAAAEIARKGVAIEVVEMQGRVAIEHLLKELLEEKEGMLEQGAVLLREAVNDLLMKYKVLKPTKRPALKAAR